MEISNPIAIDENLDLWVFIYDPEAKDYPFAIGAYEGDDNYGNYISYDPYNPTTAIGTQSGYVMLIRTYVTDGSYTYNLYRNDEVLASPIANTQYTDSDLPDGTYTYYVTTNYYGGETEASNAVSVTVPGLVAGSNWWTPTVNLTLDQLEATLGTNGILINSQDGGFAERNGDTWSGTLTSIQTGQMYKIQSDAAIPLVVSGTRISGTEVTIAPGHNWIGYAGTTAMTIGEAFSDFGPTEGDTITDASGITATYQNGAWTGTLTTLQPGQGYVYVSNATSNKTLVLP